MALRFIIRLAAALAFFPSAAFAQPVTVYAWFDAVGQNPQSGVATQGVEGGDLGLTCDTSTGPAACEWRVHMRVHNLVRLSSMGTDLFGDTGSLAISNATHGDFPGAGYTGQGHSYLTPNAGGLLAILKDVSIPTDDPDQGGPGFYNSLSFTLTALKPSLDQSLHLIDARINNLLWTHVVESGPPVFAVVGFGDAPPIPGNIVNGVAPGVIQIQSVPEPATGVLLLAALTFAVRRRSGERAQRPTR